MMKKERKLFFLLDSVLDTKFNKGKAVMRKHHRLSDKKM